MTRCAPDEDGKYPNLVGQRYRCVRDASHPANSWTDRHIGVRSDGGVDYSGYPFEWRDGEYPHRQPAEETAA